MLRLQSAGQYGHVSALRSLVATRDVGASSHNPVRKHSVSRVDCRGYGFEAILFNLRSIIAHICFFTKEIIAVE